MKRLGYFIIGLLIWPLAIILYALEALAYPFVFAFGSDREEDGRFQNTK